MLKYVNNFDSAIVVLHEIYGINQHISDVCLQLFQVWLSECYQNKAHAAFKNKQSPEAAYRSDKQPIRFVEAEVLTNAFLHCESRKVDKAGCISFMSKKYEVGIMFIGCTVDVVYDSADLTELTVEYEGHAPWKIHTRACNRRTGRKTTTVAGAYAENASRFLKTSCRSWQEKPRAPKSSNTGCFLSCGAKGGKW